MDLLAATLAPQESPRKSRNAPMVLLSQLIALFAVYLSWNCSTQQGLTLIPKLAWALLAYCFGFIYILIFAFRTRNACTLLL